MAPLTIQRETSPFTIARITLRETHLPLLEPFHTAHGVEHKRRILLTHLEDTDGATAWGECVALATKGYSEETIDTAWTYLQETIAPKILGHEFTHPNQVYPLFENDIENHQMACAAIEMPCWALVAEKTGQSLARMLGARRKHVATGIALGLHESPEALVAKVGHAIKQGYTRIKIKIQPGADIEYLSALREAFGMDLPLMVDANGEYTLDDLDHLKQLDTFGLMMIEQPLASDDITHHATLQAQMNTPICLDESILSLAHAQDMIAQDSGRIINIKPGRVGGLLPAMQIHDLCTKNDIPVWCGGMLESGIGRAYNVALAAKENFTLPGDLSPSKRYWARDIVTPEWEMNAHGMVDVPMAIPGLGVEIDKYFIESLTVRRQEITA